MKQNAENCFIQFLLASKEKNNIMGIIFVYKGKLVLVLFETK